MKNLRPARFAVLAAAFAAPLTVFAAEPTPPPVSPVPVPYPNNKIVSPRDPANGQAVGKRVHKPIRIRAYYDQSLVLHDGRTLLLNSKTGEFELGDASQAGTPPTGEILPDGSHKKKDGSTLVIHGGLVILGPAKAPTLPPTTKPKP